MKKKVIRIFAVVMMICISLLFVGCGNTDNSDDDFDWSGGGNGSQTEATNNLYGTKVLYRPDNYDYDEGSGGEAGKPNDYYGQYAHWILNDLYTLYAIPQKQRVTEILEAPFNTLIKDENGNDILYYDKYNYYLYDSIRYKVDTIGKVTKTKTIGGTETELTTPYYIIAADKSQQWKWSFDINYNSMEVPLNKTASYSGMQNYNNFVYVSFTAEDNNYMQKVSKIFSDTPAYTQNIDIFQNNETKTIKKYLKLFLGTDLQNDYENYSDFVKALEYVIYSYALDLEPQMVSVPKNSPTETSPYTVRIGAYATVDAALADIKALFKKMGSFVGLTNRQITKLQNWIKSNVIGLDDNILNDTFYDYSTGGITEILNAENEVVGFEFNQQGDTNIADLGRDYSKAVDTIVENVCENVSIGKESDGSKVPVDDRFLASEIMEYSKNMFEIIDDNNFPIGSSATDENVLRPLEYQSAVLMLNKPMGIMEVDVAIKYDADLDGTEEGVYNMDKYIDIIVELNYYNHDADKMFVVDSKKMRVYDGPYSMTFEGVEADLPEFHGTAMLSVSNIAEEGKDLLVSQEIAGVEGQLLPVKAFNPDVGNGILKTDVGKNGYGDDPKVSQKPLILTGMTDVRKYYNIVEPTDQELGNDADRFTYITGRLNPKKFSGSDGSDYLEITYKVLKEKGNTTKNYKFYTGVVAIWDADLK